MMARPFVRFAAVLGVVFVFGLAGLVEGAVFRAGLFAADPSEAGQAFVRELAGEVSAAGYETVFFDQTALARASFFRTNQLDLVVLANARQLAAQAAPALEEHLKRGGDLLALGLPAWEEARFEIAGRWLSRVDYEQTVSAQKSHSVVENFEQTDLQKWSVPRFEAVSPSYLFFPVTGPVKLSTPAGLPVEATVEMAAPPSSLLALHPRPRGIGFGQGRPWRWEPLLAAHEADGDYRGAIATLLVNAASPFRGGVWASFTPAEPGFYRQPAVKRLLREVLGGLRRGVYLVEGGSEFFTAFEEQSFHLGARVVNFGKTTQGKLLVRVRVTAKANGAGTHAMAWPLDLPADTEQIVKGIWQPERWPDGGLEVTTELLADGKVIDRLSHELHVWRPKPQPRFIEAREGGFWLEGKPWKAHGVNYMPSSGIGVADNSYFEHWLGRGAYDPEVIERDLRRIQALGMNAVSVFVYHQSLRAQHLLDFLRRCEALGLHVNQSLRPGTPMDFRWNQIKELVEFFRLAESDTVFTYDLAWEPSHFDHDYQQKHYTKLWGEWVLKRYGSVAAAERSWGAPAAPADAPAGGNRQSPIANLPVPPMSQLTRDGPWRRVAADYRAFLDELLHGRYAEARRLVKSVDAHHPVSFRMQFAGDPTHNSERLLPYDFYGLAGAVDIWEPEAYGRIGDWERVKPGHFTAAYARLCDPLKPVLWAEMGYSVWDMKTLAPQPEKLKFAARYYAEFYQMMRESGADGVFFWWYPGGFRLYENSDYGIINPDGTDRELTRIIRAEGARFLAAPKPPQPKHFIPVDRDRDARGLAGIYEAVKDEYWQALSEGKQPALKWTKKPAGGGPPLLRDTTSP